MPNPKCFTCNDKGTVQTSLRTRPCPRCTPVGQSWLHSHLEATTNILIGFFLAMGANYIILPYYGFEATVSSTFQVALFYTIISYVRGLALRRLWNWVAINESKSR